MSLPPRRFGVLSPLERQILENLRAREATTPQAEIVRLEQHRARAAREQHIASRLNAFDCAISTKIDQLCHSDGERYIKVESAFVDRRELRKFLEGRAQKLRGLLLSWSDDNPDHDYFSEQNLNAYEILLEMGAQGFACTWNSKS
jgi:hypothetical protein